MIDAPQTHGDPLAEPPRDRNVKRGRSSASRSQLSSLAGRDGSSLDEEINSPEGESLDIDEAATTELDSHPVVQGFEHLGMAKAHLEIVGTIFPGVMPVVQDLLTLLIQLVPQQAAAMLSGGAMSPAPGMAGTEALGAGGGPPMGLQQLAGTPPVGPAPAAQMATPGAMMAA